jgi:hypothetical protein
MTPERDEPLPFLDSGGDRLLFRALPAPYADFATLLDETLRVAHDTDDWTAADWDAGRRVGQVHMVVLLTE